MNKRVREKRNIVRRVIIAAALLLAVVLGGAIGAYAEKEGFFTWVKEVDTGTAIVVTPELTVLEAGMPECLRYTSYDEIPKEYKDVVWNQDVLPEGVSLEYVEMYSNGRIINIESIYSDADSHIVLNISQKVFEEEVRLSDLIFDAYEHIYTRTLKKTEIDFLQAVDEDTYKYVAYFKLDNIQYIIRSDLDLKEIEELITLFLDVTI